MMKVRIIAYTGDADVHCTTCAMRRYGMSDGLGEDREGNPVHPVFSTDEVPNHWTHCGTCGKELFPNEEV